VEIDEQPRPHVAMHFDHMKERSMLSDDVDVDDEHEGAGEEMLRDHTGRGRSAN
jgi:hypothetical protein